MIVRPTAHNKGNGLSLWFRLNHRSPECGQVNLIECPAGQKLAIVTHKPQTTRTRIHGVLEVPLKKKAKGEVGHPAAQVVLVDTPGIHKPDTQLDRRMMQEVHDALESRDAVLFIVDVTHRLPKAGEAAQAKATGRMGMSAAEDDFALSLIRKLECPVILVLNKMDAIPKKDLLPLIAHCPLCIRLRMSFQVGEEEGRAELLLDKIVSQLKDGQRYFPKHQ